VRCAQSCHNNRYDEYPDTVRLKYKISTVKKSRVKKACRVLHALWLQKETCMMYVKGFTHKILGYISVDK